ncbi:Na+/H+ antiporter NhaC family protein [Clostridium magnum]|uniref:Malate-2H(+)/Na(+)-lactate antiporter n=1 Tax=Clostridium magnum DSM 2767 TaxID=1121326 RepID=A0A162RUF1_9CLOT|nr:Na+/H+ antiporter NhaC family protein [Clostridium magnum]KZL90391.1 malate-2H(+)/Na(+)-lactate antiporter [Clostridium magnum DSM 2767]SHH83981.1 Na+:H+ antiporter, NhaC family [Clostridium magnum DSM 2767]
MAEIITIGIFLAALCICIIGKVQILYALIFGLFCFTGYSIYEGNSIKVTMGMLWKGVAKVKTILIVFALIGLLTAVWRAGGTIPFILYHAISIIQPRIFVLCTFLLCCVMSFLTGTSFGTASTMGVICMMLSNSAGLNPLLTGGAVLSGIFFGDRCSPMSSSAQLVCALTKTDIYENIKGMTKTSIVPLIFTCIFYVFAAKTGGLNIVDTSSAELFSKSFNLEWITVIPAILILLLAILHIDVKYAMGISILTGCIICLTIQGFTVSKLISCLIFGYQAPDNPRLALLLNGGGLVSMFRVGAIVTISSSYSGIFSQTKLLNGVRSLIQKISRYITSFGGAVVIAIFFSGISCNQTLAVIITEQMSSDLYTDKKELAMVLENTAIVIAPLIPWSIAGAVPITTIGATSGCLIYAVYLYALPIWNFIITLLHTRIDIRDKFIKSSI